MMHKCQERKLGEDGGGGERVGDMAGKQGVMEAEGEESEGGEKQEGRRGRFRHDVFKELFNPNRSAFH